MTVQQDLSLVGRGIYSPTEVARLARIPMRRLRRWTRGYSYTEGGTKHWSGPVISVGVGRVGDTPVLDFADLMEVRFLNAFRDQGLAWHTIRLAAERARDVLHTSHPFSSRRFSTDGHTILAGLIDETGDEKLLDLVRDQWEFERIVFEFLRKGLDYQGTDHPQSWSPLGIERTVILHPARAFGAPIVSPGSVRTRILFGAYKAEGSHQVVADWYGVTPDAVSDAVEFEQSLRRAA